MVKLIECKASSDVVSFRVDDSHVSKGVVLVEIQDDPYELSTLITAQMLPSQAIRLARTLLAAAGFEGIKIGNETRYIFID